MGGRGGREGRGRELKYFRIKEIQWASELRVWPFGWVVPVETEGKPRHFGSASCGFGGSKTRSPS